MAPQVSSLTSTSTSLGSSCASSRRYSEFGESITSLPPIPKTSPVQSRPTSRGPSKSCFGLAASRHLREFSIARHLVHPDKPVEIETIPSFEELEQDLKGWNGSWKKKKAGDLMQERIRIQMAEEMDRKLAAEERRRQFEERQEWYRRAKEDADKQLQLEAQRNEAKQKSIRLAFCWQSFGRRTVQQEERQIEELRAPVTCESCEGSGGCKNCAGAGVIHTTYLSSNTDSRSPHRRFHGQSAYGCSFCGGVRDGKEALGKYAEHAGSGKCASCGGHGKIWPKLAEIVAKLRQERKWRWEAHSMTSQTFAMNIDMRDECT
eukprot:TRINITY_DN17395_c0_g1_i1.p1 TRINITY_DN17395_c0_g1~~TRINITY_DN17395_c0_g1_i1.p1  ORF type:complete len:329 (+),score=64.54 TRINITY_DN17395_c0_g1_i1:32-988(+)